MGPSGPKITALVQIVPTPLGLRLSQQLPWAPPVHVGLWLLVCRLVVARLAHMIRFRCGLGALTHLMAMRLRLASTRPFHDRLLTVNLGKSYRLQLIHATGLPVGAGRSRALL